MVRRSLVGVLFLFSFGCGDDVSIADAARPDAGPPIGRDAGRRDAGAPRDAGSYDAATEEPLASAMIGPEGGVVSGEGVILGFPPGSVDTMMRIEVYSRPSDDSSFESPLSPIYRFEPSGTRFAMPIVVNIDVPPGTVGRLFWSREGDEGTFEPVGYAEDGRARALVEHFSSGVVASDRCTVVTDSQTCSCIATDRGDALCVGAPPEMCFADGGWIGTPGGACSGYGERPELTVRCTCSGMGHTLCPVPHDLPAETCPGGEMLFTGFPGDSCYGYYMTEMGAVRYSQGTSGTIAGCTAVMDGTVWVITPGMLGNCRPRMPNYPMWEGPGGSGPEYPPMGPAGVMCD